MKHRIGYRKLNKSSSARKALLRSLAVELVTHGRILTTLERAKELRRVVEPLVSQARQDSLAARRLVASRLNAPDAVKKLFTQWGPANASRPGGYTRILRMGFRAGDHARRAVIEFVDGAPQAVPPSSAAPAAGAEVTAPVAGT